MVTMLLLWCYPGAGARGDDCGAIPTGAKIAEVGAFSNMRYTEEHAYGYTVMLWLAGDTPIGELQGVKFDQKKGALSFSAKLRTGVVSPGDSKGLEPFRDLFTFDGDLRASRLTGSETYGEWREKWQPALRFRGPKWQVRAP